MLVAAHGLTEAKARELARISFGQPGYAIDLIKDENLMQIKKEAEMVTKNPSTWKKTVSGLVNIENKHKIEPFIKVLTALLAVSPVENCAELSSVINRLTMMKDW